MTDADQAAGAVASEDTEALVAGARAAEEAAALAKAADDEAVAALQGDHDAALRKLDELKVLLAQSFAKAKEDAGHLSYHASFVRDVGLKVDEIASWIGRNI